MFNFIRSTQKFNLPLFSYFDICVDFGTSNTRIAVKDKGIVLREATIVGLNTKTREYVFYGDEAKKIIGKTPDFIKIIKPIINSVISDFDSQTALMHKFVDKAISPYLQSYRLIKPPMRAVCIVPSIATEIEQRAINEVLAKIGATKIYLIEKPIASAAGSGISIFSHEPHLIVDLGGGLIEMAIISGGGVVVKKTLKNAGEHMNSLIANYCYLKYGIILGEMTTEQLKINLLNFANEERTMTVRGKSLENGLPKSVRIKSSEVKEALLTNYNQIIDGVKELIEMSPPEVVEEIYNRGLILSGELTKIEKIESFFATELKIDVMVSPHAGDSTIHGLLHIIKHNDDLEKLAFHNS